MVLMFFIALLLWIGTGLALFYWHARPSGSTFTRAADRTLVPAGGNVRVSLHLIPPVMTATTTETHDVVLLLDQSGSMGDGPGSALSAALRAAENFVRRCPPPVRIGLIAFNSAATVLSAITSDREAVLRGLQSVTAGDASFIHTALAAAVDLIEATPRPAERTTVILLTNGASEYPHALAQAERLRERAQIIAIDLGEAADATVLNAIAGSSGRYCHAADPSALPELFATLAGFVSSERITGLIEEPAFAPRPFQLAHTGTFHPIAVRGDGGATIAWSIPVMDSGPVSLSYDLVAEVAGWHPVARSGGRAIWRLPDGTQQTMSAPDGPYVLVLPAMFQWAWPVLNPLFWMLFGKLFRRPRSAVRVEPPAEEPDPLAIPSLPTPLAPSQPALYEPRVRPALVIGIGEAGEWAVTHLGHRLADRGIGRDTIDLLAVRATFDRARDRIRAGVFELPDARRIELTQDLRPYLETLRHGVPSVRRWIPASEWLGRIGPRTTDWTHDRREARLALLQRPDELEARIGEAIATMKSRGMDEAALVIGSALDPECSGMIAEVAHMLSVAGAQTTAIVSKPRVFDGRGANEVAALAHEFERMVRMRGDEVLSDRRDPPASARQLFDRLIVLRDDADAPADEGRSIADTAWQLLAYADVLRRVPMACPDATGAQVECCALEQTSTHLPVESLWQWVRARALVRAVNGHWLGAKVVDGAVQIPAPALDAVTKWMNAFWTPSGFGRPQGVLLRSVAGLLADGKGASVHALRGRLPVEASYEQQAEFADRERKSAAYFLEEWTQALLDEAHAQRQCGLPLLLAVLREIESGLDGIPRRFAESATDPGFAAAGRLAVTLYSDLASTVARFRQSVEATLADLAGTQVALGVFATERESVCARIDRMRRDAEEGVLFPSAAVRDEAERREAIWYQQYGKTLLDQLRLRFVRAGKRAEVMLELSGKPAQPDVLGALETFFASYRAEVLAWPLADALEPASVDEPGRRFRVGAASSRVHPDVIDPAEDADPYIAATMRVDRLSVDDAFAVQQRGVRRLPYVWPEEANAMRVSALVSNVLARRPQPFSAAAVHLLRDTNTLHAFLTDLAEQRVFLRNGRCWLSRNDTEHWIGEPASSTSSATAIANFENIARQTAILSRSLDAVPIPPRREPCNYAPEELVSLVERHALVQPATNSVAWEMWKDVIRGVALDAEQRRMGGVAVGA
jgi:Mg-chelatase subunit ChlD